MVNPYGLVMVRRSCVELSTQKKHMDQDIMPVWSIERVQEVGYHGHNAATVSCYIISSLLENVVEFKFCRLCLCREQYKGKKKIIR